MMSYFPKAIVLGFLTGILGLLIGFMALGYELEEDIGLELLFKLRGVREAPPDVILVNLDRESVDALQLPSKPRKWPRSLHARLIHHLIEKGAAVIAFDLVFTEAHAKAEDGVFAQAIRDASNVVLCALIRKDYVSVRDKDGRKAGDLYIERLVPPIECLERAAVAVAPFPLPERPVKVKQCWMFKTGAGDRPTLPFVAFQLFAMDFHEDFVRVLTRVRPSLGSKLPHDKDKMMSETGVLDLMRTLRNLFAAEPGIAERMIEYIKKSDEFSEHDRKRDILVSLIRTYSGACSRYLNYYGPAGTVQTVPYFRLIQKREGSLENPTGGGLPDFRGKAVFVGLSERLQSEMKDGFYTVFSQPNGLDLSGVEIAATAFANLLEDRPIRPIGVPMQLVVTITWGMVLGLTLRLFPSAMGALTVIGLSVLYLFAVLYQFKGYGNWYPLAIPLFVQAPFALLGAYLWKYFDTNRERNHIRTAFKYYLPIDVVDQIANKMPNTEADGRVLFGVCLFTDAVGYTSLSEKMAPLDLHRFMQGYFKSIFEPVLREGGIVSQIAGDGMLAIWTTTGPDREMRHRACVAALEIARVVNRFNRSAGPWQLPIRIGLHSGSMFLGNVGTTDHYEYRPSGDIVNTASRIENLNKALGTVKLISREVLCRLDGFLTREVGEFLVTGKSKPVVVHELVCLQADATEDQITLCTTFERALCAYREKRWDEAVNLFGECLDIDKTDGPVGFYLNRCRVQRVNPSGVNGTGLIVLGGTK